MRVVSSEAVLTCSARAGKSFQRACTVLKLLETRADKEDLFYLSKLMSTREAASVSNLAFCEIGDIMYTTLTTQFQVVISCHRF